MLTKADLDFIKDSHDEIRTLREESITLNIRAKTGSHPVTDEPIYDVTDDIVSAVVTKVTSTVSASGNNTNEINEGIKVVTGDIIVDVNLRDFPEGKEPKDVNTFEYNEITYKVITFGKLGLGESNRVEMLGRRAY